MAPAPAPTTASPTGLASIDDLTLAHQRVLVRVDFDVPLGESGEVSEDRKLVAALPTLRKALEAGARVVVATHLTGAGGRAVSLEPVAAKLAELLGQEVYLPDECVGDSARKVVGDLREGQLCLLENLDFAPEELAGDDTFARKLSALCDVYISEAFTCSTERRASLVALPKLVKDRAMGYQLKSELEGLARAAVTAQKPFIGILGGAGLARNSEMLEAMLKRCDTICVAGVPGNTLLAARELDLKQSTFERDQLARARTLLSRARDLRVELLLPVDATVATGPNDGEGRSVSVGSIPDGASVLDVGPKTIELFRARIQGAKTVLLHGALGQLESPAFAQGTRAVLEALADASAFGVVTGSAITTLAQGEGSELAGKIGFISTGGMASLAVIEGKKLPGVEALRGSTWQIAST